MYIYMYVYVWENHQTWSQVWWMGIMSQNQHATVRQQKPCRFYSIGFRILCPWVGFKIVHSYLYLQEIIFIFPMKCRVYSLSSPAKCAISESLAQPDLKALSPYFHASLTQRLLRMTRKPEAEDWCPPTNLRICNDCNVPLGSLGHVGFFESDK